MISHKHKFIFIHTLKCAGTSIEKTLSDGVDIFDWNHKCKINLPFGALRNEHLAKTINRFPSYYLFTFCRNPFSRLVSTYCHSHRDKDNGDFMAKSSAPTFKEYVCQVGAFLKGGSKQDELSCFDRMHCQPQTTFVPIPGRPFYGEIMRHDVNLDFLGKLESINEDFTSLLKDLNLPAVKLKLENNHDYQGKNHMDYYDKETLEAAQEIYAKDFEYFGYEFGG